VSVASSKIYSFNYTKNYKPSPKVFSLQCSNNHVNAAQAGLEIPDIIPRKIWEQCMLEVTQENQRICSFQVPNTVSRKQCQHLKRQCTNVSSQYPARRYLFNNTVGEHTHILNSALPAPLLPTASVSNRHSNPISKSLLFFSFGRLLNVPLTFSPSSTVSASVR